MKDNTKGHSFCEKEGHTCNMNYCDENGCQERERKLSILSPVVAPSEEVKQKTDNEIYIEKLEGLLRNYREHVGWHEGIDYLRECDDSQYLTSEDMRFIKDL